MQEGPMAPREKLSIGRAGVQAEGPRTSVTLVVGGIILLSIGYFTGHWAVLINSCFGFKF
jgi:hypothetical protein